MSATHNITSDLGSVLREYQLLRRMTAAEVLAREGGKLNREIKFQLLAIAPKPGEIRQELLARLWSGRGIKIRQSVREKNEIKMLRHWVKRFGFRPGRRKQRSNIKKLNYQNELIKREIGRRESGRRVLGVSVRHPSRFDALGGGLTVEHQAMSRYGGVLSTAGVRIINDGGIAQIRWPGMSVQGKPVLEGIRRPRAQAAIVKAINARRQDMLTYIRRKHTETATRAVRKMIAPQKRWSQSALSAEIRRVMEGKA